MKTASQRATRGVLEYWAKGGDSDTAAMASAYKERTLHSSVASALAFPDELLGDIYADPDEVKKAKKRGRNVAADAPQTGTRLSDDEVAVLKGWRKVAEDERATKEAFDTFRSMRDDPITAAPTTPPASVKGYSREELLALRDAAPEGPVVLEGEKRRLPAVRWSACDKRATSNGAARNCAPTSL